MASGPGSPLAPGKTKAGYEEVAALIDARAALVALGWKPVVARAAIEAAHAHVGAGGGLEALIREGLLRCPKPGGPS